MSRDSILKQFSQIRYYRFKDGTQQWYDHWNRLHRVDGPAIIFPDGTEHWIRHAKHHRTDGPAIIHPDGRTRWCINDEQIRNQDEYQRLAEITDEDLAVLILKYGNIE